MKFKFQLTEYVILRLIRKFIFSYNFLLKFGKYIPYFKVNTNQDNASILVDRYIDLLRKNCPELLQLNDLRILEIGAGTTNTVGLLLAEKLACNVDVYDPFVEFDIKTDETNKKRFKIKPETEKALRRINELVSNKYQLILSNSVLEHVENPELLFHNLKNVLTANGKMLHIVDYRDHFFKYPYFFLMFTDKAWNRWLNPGDLFRWRMDDHIDAAEKNQLKINILEREILEKQYNIIKNMIEEKFNLKQYNEIATAVLIVNH
jgi:SAM-dependent methyltransferase